jgi:hypothetical protein
LNWKKKEAFESTAELTEEELLQELAFFLADERIKIGTAFLKDEMDLIIGTKVLIVCGDFLIEGRPAELSWPLQHLPIPDALKLENPERFN